MTPKRAFVALVFRPWEHALEAENLALPVQVRMREGDPIGFMPIYRTRAEAETAHPGRQVSEIAMES